MSFSTEPNYKHGSQAKTGILLVNLGTPDAATPVAVRRYLKEFLSDTRIVEIPRLIWWFILNIIILNVRPKKTAAKYSSIWMAEGSPLRVYTERQARLVEGVFAKQPGVLHASVAFGSRRLYVEFDPAKTNRETLFAVAAKAGIVSFTETASPAAAAAEHDEHEHEHGGPFGERSELVFSLMLGARTGITWGLEKLSLITL